MYHLNKRQGCLLTHEHEKLENCKPYSRTQRHQDWFELLSQGSTATRTSMGTTGLAVTGGAFFNDWSSTDGDVALYNEGGSRAKISIFKKNNHRSFPRLLLWPLKWRWFVILWLSFLHSVVKHGSKRCLPLALLCLIIRLVPPSYEFCFIPNVIYISIVLYSVYSV